MTKIFISYRQQDSSGSAGRLYDHLAQHFGAENVFLDVATLYRGAELTPTIRQTLASCSVFIAVIGPSWLRSLNARSASGAPQLDFVQLEIGAALDNNLLIIPVLVDEARFPELFELPEKLRPLVERAACKVRHDSFASDVSELVRSIKAVPGIGIRDSDNAVLRRLGHGSSPPRFRRLVERLVEEYLVGPAQSVPFGGRSKELLELNGWLADATAERLLLTAPGGRGKTALALSFAMQIEASWHVIFAPVSVRAGTNRPEIFYGLLSSALSSAMGTAALRSSDAESEKDAISAQVDQLARSDRRVLLILDGLDEAIGWTFDAGLLPSRLPRNLKVLATARPLAGDHESIEWLRRLRWERLTKPPRIMRLVALSPQAIADVLDQMGCIADDETIRELMRLTEGEPVLIRYYAEDLWCARQEHRQLTIDDLRRLSPGFGSYFRDWLDHQRSILETTAHTLDEHLCDAVLAVLATALGPIAERDLQAVVSRIVSEPRLSTSMLRPFQRFMMGKGSAENGYVLQHPKLGEFLRSDWFKDGPLLKRAARAIVDWGRETMARLASGAMDPVDCSRYLLQFLGQHLQMTSAPAGEFIELTGKPWLRAWEAFETGHYGFAQEIHRAVRAAGTRPVNQPWRSWLIQCEMLMTSIRMASSIPAALLTACAAKQVFAISQALRRLEFCEPQSQVLGRVQLLDLLPEHDRSPALNEALAIARAIPSEPSRVKALSAVAMKMPTGNERDAVERELMHAVQTCGNMASWLEAVSDAMPALSVMHQEHLLHVMLANINRDYEWYRLDFLLRDLAEGLRREARSMCAYRQMTFNDDDSGDHAQGQWEGLHGQALTVLFPYLSDPERVSARSQALNAARGLVGWQRILALANVYGTLDEHEKTAVAEEMLASALTLDDTLHLRIYCLCRVARVLSGDAAHVASEAALAIALKDLAESMGSRLGPIAPLLNRDQIKRCYDVALASHYRSTRADALGHLAPYLSVDQLAGALKSLRDVGSDLSGEREYAIAVIALTAQLPEGEFERLRALSFDTIRNSNYKAAAVPILQEIFQGHAPADIAALEEVARNAPDFFLQRLSAEEAKAIKLDVAGAIARAYAKVSLMGRIEALALLLHVLEDAKRREVMADILTSLQSDISGRGLWYAINISQVIPPDCEAALIEALPSLQKSSTRSEHFLAVAGLARAIAKLEGPEGVRAIIKGMQTAMSTDW